MMGAPSRRVPWLGLLLASNDGQEIEVRGNQIVILEMKVPDEPGAFFSCAAGSIDVIFLGKDVVCSRRDAS
jgi:hypothetical protein